MKLSDLALIIVFFFSITGCTSVHVYNKDGLVNVTQGFGILDLSVSDKSSVFIADLKGLGITKVGSDITVGYTQQKIATTDASCKVIFWIEDTVQTEKIIELLKSLDDGVCTIHDVNASK
jgi:hypothetical protein